MDDLGTDTWYSTVILSGWDSTGGIVTHYGLDSPGFEPQSVKIFHTHPDEPQGPLQPPV
jgi:hypothetical protein